MTATTCPIEAENGFPTGAITVTPADTRQEACTIQVASEPPTARPQIQVPLATSIPLPESLEELRIPQSLVLDLFLRHTYVQGRTSMQSLGSSMKLPFSIVEAMFRHFREQHLIDVKGMVGNDYLFTLTKAGREQAADLCQYSGPVPVPLSEYCRVVRSQVARVKLDRKKLRKAFWDLTVTDRLIDQMGPALIAQRSLFLYGPAGNGKSSLAERLPRVYEDAVLIPYAVEVDGRIIVLFDPAVHERIVSFDVGGLDPRWVPCRRPCITVGGELVSSMLELRSDHTTGTHAAPLQMKANNGVFIIDDFGHQIMSPRDLLNRWIVPLDRRIDHLTLNHGLKFQIPFEVMVVFSTNLDPGELADAAFLRRIPNKINVGVVEPETFDEIFRCLIAEKKLDCDADAAHYLRDLCLARGDRELRACFPRDICDVIASICEYEQHPLRIGKAELDMAVDMYFPKFTPAA